MLRALAIVSGLATASVLLVPTAYADPMCKQNYSHCNDVVIYVCRDRELGNRDFVGGSDLGYADQIALNKAARAGYDTDYCRKRSH
jgi:hypothetical protein